MVSLTWVGLMLSNWFELGSSMVAFMHPAGFGFQADTQQSAQMFAYAVIGSKYWAKSCYWQEALNIRLFNAFFSKSLTADGDNCAGLTGPRKMLPL